MHMGDLVHYLDSVSDGHTPASMMKFYGEKF